MSLNSTRVRNKNAHIVFFVKRIKEIYGLPNLLGNHFYRKAVVYICRQFNGLGVDEVKILVRSQWQNVNGDVQSAIQLKENGHPSFMKAYNDLLEIYIACTREFLKAPSFPSLN